jgi:hypothetical protein
MNFMAEQPDGIIIAFRRTIWESGGEFGSKFHHLKNRGKVNYPRRISLLVPQHLGFIHPCGPAGGDRAAQSGFPVPHPLDFR